MFRFCLFQCFHQFRRKEQKLKLVKTNPTSHQTERVEDGWILHFFMVTVELLLLLCGHWPGQGAYVSKRVEHNEERESDPGQEEHTHTLRQTDTNKRDLVPLLTNKQTLHHLWTAVGTSRQVCSASPNEINISTTFLGARRTSTAASALFLVARGATQPKIRHNIKRYKSLPELCTRPPPRSRRWIPSCVNPTLKWRLH